MASGQLEWEAIGKTAGFSAEKEFQKSFGQELYKTLAERDIQNKQNNLNSTQGREKSDACPGVCR